MRTSLCGAAIAAVVCVAFTAAAYADGNTLTQWAGYGAIIAAVLVAAALDRIDLDP